MNTIEPAVLRAALVVAVVVVLAIIVILILNSYHKSRYNSLRSSIRESSPYRCYKIYYDEDNRASICLPFDVVLISDGGEANTLFNLLNRFTTAEELNRFYDGYSFGMLIPITTITHHLAEDNSEFIVEDISHKRYRVAVEGQNYTLS